jgi:hypothetical protein
MSAQQSHEQDTARLSTSPSPSAPDTSSAPASAAPASAALEQSDSTTIDPALLTAPDELAIWVNPFFRLLRAAKKAGDTSGIKHDVVSEGPMPVQKPWADNRSLVDYRAAACEAEMSHQLSVIIPCTVAVQNPDLDYNQVMEKTYWAFRVRVRRLRMEKSHDPQGIMRGDYNVGPTPEGTQESVWMKQVILDTMRDYLVKHDIAYLGSGTIRRQEILLWECLHELKRWTVAMDKEMLTAEKSYRDSGKM